eukprot:CAMPEP_0203670440 /NCGR_PEP_ID=MMETSP0090-20130426/6510_1 /ASSEMBLY_ACC=CAM_ASM_001088 /TAXON_ID=426623 /ORGANISM="Chaetoceros affinis, Strain CCMP159" /LENGTH=798 /DNA_ID=CAMNT_0050535301 /DNA_START=251 /DNA_END=2647 /DNA_ORIENTATION=-
MSHNHNPAAAAMHQLFKSDYPTLIPYQIDFQTRTIGKHISLTKRFCHWRFGFAHIPSLLSSKSGVANRGMEFEVKFIWSIASGKHELYMNNYCISSSSIPTYGSIGSNSNATNMNRSTNKFDETFNIPQSILPGGHILHITAYSNNFKFVQSNANTNAMNMNTADGGGGGISNNFNSQRNESDVQHQQFIMRLDGQRYSQFCKIYELGSANMLNKYRLVLEKARSFSGNGAHANANSSVNNSQSGNSAPPKIHHTNEDGEETDSVVRGRPRYRPKSSEGRLRSIHYMNMNSNNNNTSNYPNSGIDANTNVSANRTRSNTADNDIQIQQRRQQQQQQFSYDQPILASKSEDIHYNNSSSNHQNYFNQNNEDDRYWERTPVLPTRTFGNQQQQNFRSNKPKALSPRRRSKKAFPTIPKNSTQQQQQHKHYASHHYGMHKFDERDVANNSVQEQKYIAEARINSFRDLRGEQQYYENNHNPNNGHYQTQQPRQSSQYKQHQPEQHQHEEEEDNMTVPTFARPPREITSKTKGHVNVHRNENSSNQDNNNQSHLKGVNETNSISDLLDRNNNNNINSPDRNSISGEISTLIRSTSSLTLDTMLRDIDASTIATEKYPHLDPNPMQMMKTQQNLNFKLQLHPPVYADSSAGDLIQPTPSFGGVSGGGGNSNAFAGTTSSNIGGMNSNAGEQGGGFHASGHGHASVHQHHQYHAQVNSTNLSSAPSPSMNYRPMSFTPQHHQFHQHNPMNYAGRHMEMGVSSTNQQQQTQPADFVAPPPPTWDALNIAFGPTPVQQNKKQFAQE